MSEDDLTEEEQALLDRVIQRAMTKFTTFIRAGFVAEDRETGEIIPPTEVEFLPNGNVKAHGKVYARKQTKGDGDAAT